MSEQQLRRLFYHLLWITLLLKFAWAAYLPLTGDEVYFHLWGKNPGMGFYDHPPMVGWWLSLLLWFGDANWWLRTPAVLLSSGIALVIHHLLRRVLDEPRALLGAILYLLSPLSLINVLITTDTPLIIFSFLSAWAFSRAMAGGQWRWYLISGLLLGAAFMSKYFAVLLGISYGLYILIYRRNRRDMLGLLWVFLAVLPFAGLNIWWNYCHCWNNILFNAVNRQNEPGVHTVSYLLMLVYMITPPLLWYGWRERQGMWRGLQGGSLFLFLALAPLLLFLLLSLKARIGLHWVLAFYPFIFIALTPLFPEQALRRSLKFMAGFTLLHIVILLGIFAVPHHYWEKKPEVYEGLLMGFYPERFVDQFREKADGYHWATGSYVDSALLGYVSGRHFSVFGESSKYGRHDDQLTDWRSLDGKDIALLMYNADDSLLHKNFFKHAEVIPFKVKSREYYLLLGQGFRYELYRRVILTLIRDKYYRYPAFLPQGECYFYQRYFPGEGVQRLPQ